MSSHKAPCIPLVFKSRVCAMEERLSLFWTVDCQAPPSMWFSRQEYSSGLPFPSPVDLPNPGLNLGLLDSRIFFYHLSHQGSPKLVRSLFLKVLQSTRSQAVHRQKYLEKLHLILDTYTYLSCWEFRKEKSKEEWKKITERIQLWYVHDMSLQPGFEGWTSFEAEKRKKKLGSIHSIGENGKQWVFNIHFPWIIKVAKRKTGEEKRILLHSWVIMMKEE